MPGGGSNSPHARIESAISLIVLSASMSLRKSATGAFAELRRFGNTRSLPSRPIRVVVSTFAFAEIASLARPIESSKLGECMKFRKKPVVIEAFRLAHDLMPDWWLAASESGKVKGSPDGFVIATLEGHMTARAGDWIVRGVEGEIYPVKSSIFEATYEPVKE
jgi:hypothetical protein